MKHVSIVVPEGDCSITNIEGTQQIMLKVNDYLSAAGRPPLFKVQLVGQHPEIIMKNGVYSIRPEVLIKDLHHTDLIIIPSVHGDKACILEDNDALLAWIAGQHRKGAA